MNKCSSKHSSRNLPLLRVENGQPVAGSAAGRRRPYVPERTAALRIGVVRAGWDASLEGVSVSSQFSDFANTSSASLNGSGQTVRLAGYTFLNLAVSYTPARGNWSLYGTIKNTSDCTYIADRTRGILPGFGRQVVVGARIAL